MLFRDIVKEKNPIAFQMIKNAITNNKLSHAFIFSAQKDYEIIDEPYFLIQSLISNDPFTSGELNNVDKYMDLIVVDGSQELIKKDFVISAINRMQETSIVEGGKKILFIRNLENANTQSLNSLLKFIEEPTDNTYIIMTTNNISQVLSTIKSRSQIIPLRSFSTDIVLNALKEKGYPQKLVGPLSSISNSLNQAELEMKNGFEKKYNDVISYLESAIMNKAHIISKFKSIVTSSNYQTQINILRSFINDIWKKRESLPTIFDDQNLINKYALSKFNFNKALMAIDSFYHAAERNSSFPLNLSRMLIEMEEAYE